MTRRAPLALGAAAVAALALWAFFPVVLLVLHARSADATFTGADGLIGANGVLGADQLQYLAWARSIAGHGLAADLFTLGRSGHVFLEPASGIVGGLLAAGVPLLAGALLVKAFAVTALALAALAWVRRLEPAPPARPAAQLAAVALALFAVTPATSLVNWLAPGSARFRFDVYLAGDELLSATKLWGYVPAALAIALMPVCLLALERALGGAPGASGSPRRAARRPLLLSAGAALMCAWLHPWQGITLALIVVALAALRRRRVEGPAIALVALAAVLPLAYYGVLSHADPAWRVAAHNEEGARLPLSVWLLCVGPMVALAALGARRPGRALAEQALVLWIPAALVTYFANDAFATHALEGLSLPFAVLAVRGARRVRLPAPAAGACLVLLTVPGLAYAARKFVRTSQSGLVQYALGRDDAAAIPGARLVTDEPGRSPVAWQGSQLSRIIAEIAALGN